MKIFIVPLYAQFYVYMYVCPILINGLIICTGLLRCGKSCRLRWMNYLRPNLKKGNFTPEETDFIIRMHSILGNKYEHKPSNFMCIH